METGDIVKSKRGHDTGRLYVVIATVSAEFVLVADGKYRKLADPKLKRVKHLSAVGKTTVEYKTDAALRRILKGGNNAEK